MKAACLNLSITACLSFPFFCNMMHLANGKCFLATGLSVLDTNNRSFLFCVCAKFLLHYRKSKCVVRCGCELEIWYSIMAHPRALLLRQYCPAIDSGGMSHPDRPDMTAHTLGRKKERERKRERDSKTWTETAGECLDQYLAEIRMTAMKHLFPWYTIRGSNRLSVRRMDKMSRQGFESGSNLLQT